MHNKYIDSALFHINNIRNKFLDKKLKSKILVIESDDWGNIRMPSLESLASLSRKFNVNSSHYLQNDSLVSSNDLSLLLEVLNSVKDINGNGCKITSNFVTANPDYNSIINGGYDNYFSESIIDSYNKASDVNFRDIKMACNTPLFQPQLHGREHVNTSRWMHALKGGDEITRYACKYSVSGLTNAFLAAFDMDTIDELPLKEKVLVKASTEFESIFGFKSRTFVAPNYTWSPLLEKKIRYCGIELIQTQRDQLTGLYNKNKKKYHYFGEINDYGSFFSMRNVMFEPSSNMKVNWVDSALKQISSAFKRSVPAILSSHRVNFVGRLNIKNRDNTLFQLEQLLKRVRKEWPDVIFLSSDELIDLLKK